MFASRAFKMSATTNQLMGLHIQKIIFHRHQCEKAILTMYKRFSVYYCLKYLKESSGYLHAEDVSVRNLQGCRSSWNPTWFTERKYLLLYSTSASFWILSYARWNQSTFSCSKNNVNFNVMNVPTFLLSKLSFSFRLPFCYFLTSVIIITLS